jgi:hypothetical protein
MTALRYQGSTTAVIPSDAVGLTSFSPRGSAADPSPKGALACLGPAPLWAEFA